MAPVWSAQQDAALKAVSRWLKDKNGPQVFRLFGWAGTGKSTLAVHLAQDVRSVRYAAFTGKAAMVMRKRGCKGAQTIHSLIYTLVSEKEGEPRFVEAHRLLEDVRAAWCRGRAGRTAEVGTRMPVQAEAARWLADALDLAGPGGRVVVLDYVSHSRELAARPWTEWVRTYAAHGRAGSPHLHPGSRDITVEVAVDQLATVAPPTSDRTQAEWLRAHGIEALVEEGRRRWAELGPAGGLDAIAARSRVHEADALLDPAGLGAFHVLEWRP